LSQTTNTNLQTRWVLRQTQPDAVGRLARELKLSEITATLLINRGITDAEAAHSFLYPRLSDLHDPFLMQDMRKAVDRIMRAIAQKEKVLVYGDYDVDGGTSTVILKKALSMIGADVAYYIPQRLRDGYGLRVDAMDEARAKGFNLVISVDTGIRAWEVAEHARRLGLDLIVTDHHLPGDALPAAFAILNPKRSDCLYPNKNLAGVGVAFKLAQALLIETGRERYVESFTKIAAIGTIADIVPLVGENRVIAKYGLQGLARPRNPGLRALLNVAGLEDKEVSGSDVAFRVAPRINAVGRMGGASNAVELFEAPDIESAMKLALDMDEHNAARQRTEAEVVAQVVAELERDVEFKDSRIAVIAGEGWHRGVIGIAASKIVERINRPAIIISIEDGIGHGSGRSIQAFHLLDGLTSCTDLFERFGGHSHAAGLVVRAENVDELRRRLNQYALQVLTDDDLTPVLQIDSMLQLKQVTYELTREMKLLEPYGAGNPEPLFQADDVQVVSPPRTVNERHLKLRVLQGSRWIDCIWWNEAARAAHIFPGDRLSLAFNISEHTWNDLTQIQLSLCDVRIKVAS
jgi:single-stranded-DNA-specific exonuclease